MLRGVQSAYVASHTNYYWITSSGTWQIPKEYLKNYIGCDEVGQATCFFSEKKTGISNTMEPSVYNKFIYRELYKICEHTTFNILPSINNHTYALIHSFS